MVHWQIPKLIQLVFLQSLSSGLTQHAGVGSLKAVLIP
jgi:hypothetical protein